MGASKLMACQVIFQLPSACFISAWSHLPASGAGAAGAAPLAGAAGAGGVSVKVPSSTARSWRPVRDVTVIPSVGRVGVPSAVLR